MKTKKYEQLAAAPPDNSRHNNWHPAFIQALQMELRDYRDVLEFHSEYELTSGPLKIDCVIIKKAKDAIIKKNIAAIFREWNIVEYKSPGDYVSIEDFNKVHAYAYLYAWLNKVPITSLTISFVESRYPRKLLKNLQKEHGYTVEKTASGIYTINGDVMPVQIVDSRELSADENLWLKSLSDKLDVLEVEPIIDEVARQGKSAQTDAYLNIIMNANYETVQEAIEMRSGLSPIEQVFENVGWLDKWEAQGETKGKIIGFEEGKREIARKMKDRGQPLAEIAEITDLPMETIEQL